MKRILLVSLAAVATSSAFGQQVFSRGALGGDDFIDWGQFGATFTNVACGSGSELWRLPT